MNFGLIPPLGVLKIVVLACWLMGAIRCSKESLYLGLYCFAWRIKCLCSAINVYRFRVRSSDTLSVGFFLPVPVGFALVRIVEKTDSVELCESSL